MIIVTGISFIETNPLFADCFLKGCGKSQKINNLYAFSISKEDLSIEKKDIKILELLKIDNLDVDKIFDSFLLTENKLSKIKKEKLLYEIESDTQYSENEIFYAEGNVQIFLPYGVFKADKISYDREKKVLKAFNNIEFQSGNQIFNADYLAYDFNSDSGSISNINGIIDFTSIEKDINYENFVFEDKKCLREENNLIDLKEEVELLNSNNVRVAGNSSGIKGFKFDFSSIVKWRFKSEKILFEKDKWKSDLIYFTNDPYNEPQLILTSKNFEVKTVKERTLLLSKSTSINFDNKFSMPLGRRTITDGKVNSRWGLGYESKDKDGLYLMRSFDPISFGNEFKLNATPYFLIQRIISGNTNSFREKGSSVISENIQNDIELGDYIGINADLRGEVFEFDLNADIDIKTLNPNKFYDAFSLDLNLIRNIYSSSKVEGEDSNNELCGEQDSNNIKLDNHNIDFGIYTRFDKDDIYLGYGSKLTNRYNSSKNKITKDYSIVFDVGEFQGKGLENNNKLIRELRYGTNISLLHKYKLFDLNNYEEEFNNQYKNTPELVDQGVFLNAKFASGLYEYSNKKSQAVYSFGVGPSFTFGELKKNFFDYTNFSIVPEFIIKNGESPFKFDDFNNDSRVRLDLKQQIFGPIIFGFKGDLNINNNSSSYGVFENKTYSLGISRRAYSIDLGYNENEKSVFLGFNIFNFNFNKINDKF